MKKNYLFNLLLSVSNILFPIISFPYVSRTIGPVGIGKVQFVTSFASYFSLIAALGIPIYGIREIAKSKHDPGKLSGVFSELTIIYFFTSIALSAVYLALVYIFPFFAADKALYLYAIVLVILGFSSIDWFYEGLEEFKTVAVRSVVVRMIALAMMFLLIRKPEDYFYYLLIIIFTTVSNNAINIFLLRKRTWVTFKKLSLKRHMRPLLLIFSTTIATSMYTMMDTVLLGFLSNEKAVGLYTAAVKLAKIAIPIVTSLGIILVPRLAKNLAEKNHAEVQSLLDKSFNFIAFFSIPIGFGLAILAPELIVVFSSRSFLGATFSMQLLALLPVSIGFGYFFGFQVLIPAGRDKEMLFSVLGGVVISLALNFLLVPGLKEVGASIANIGSEIVVTCLYLFFVKRHFDFKFHFKPLYSAFLSSLLFIPVIILFRMLHLNIYITLIACIAGSGLVYIGMQKFIFKNILIEETLLNAVFKKFPFLQPKSKSYGS